MLSRNFTLFNESSSTGQALPPTPFLPDFRDIMLLSLGCMMGLAMLFAVGLYFVNRCDEKAKIQSLLSEKTPLTQRV